MAVKIIRSLDAPPRAVRTLFKRNNQYFVASTVILPIVGLETLILRANKWGEITSWSEVGGGRMLSNADAIAIFDAQEQGQ